jgi:RIO kinase 1
MNRYTDDLDQYTIYEEAFDPHHDDRRSRRRRQARQPKQRHPVPDDLADEAEQTDGVAQDFYMSYTPAQHEGLWLRESLAEFFQQALISDVEALVKGGKEANVYRCTAHPATGERWLAAKVYRPRMFRNLRNDHRYRLGRTTLLPNGRPVRATDARLKKAMAGKTAFGKQLAHISWLMHEYGALEVLYEAGGAVPRPVAAGGNAILMGYVGDGRGAAPTLHETTLDQQEARSLFDTIIDNVALMLAYGRVHGDLSAYNILCWDGEVTLIDFPQVVNSHVAGHTQHPLDSSANPDAFDILGRDIQRVCDHFARYGVRADASRLHEALWLRYVGDDREARLAVASRWEVE